LRAAIFHYSDTLLDGLNIADFPPAHESNSRRLLSLS
jgi:hypothetical protein